MAVDFRQTMKLIAIIICLLLLFQICIAYVLYLLYYWFASSKLFIKPQTLRVYHHNSRLLSSLV